MKYATPTSIVVLCATQDMYIYSLIVVLLPGFLTDATASRTAVDTAIHNMIRQITRTYFTRSSCVVFVSGKREALNNVKLEELPIMRVVLGEKSQNTVLHADDTDVAGRSAQELELLLKEALDAGCLTYIVQVANVKAIILSLARAVTRSIQRVARNYAFLPSENTQDMDAFTEELLSMKELEIMPNILIAKIYSKFPYLVSSETALKLRGLFCKDEILQPQVQEPDRTEDALRQGREFIENLSLSFKSTKDEPILRPKFRAINHDNNNSMVIAIELVTNSFVGPNSSKETFLDIFMQFKSEAYFALCADLYPDKTRDLQGKIVTAIAIPYLPFVIMDQDAVPPLHEGIEILIYRELVKKLNGTTRVVYDPEHLWGIIFENGTGNGIVGNVLNGDADIGFSALYLNWYNEWLWTDFSYPYCQSAAILVVPRPKLLPGYFVPVLPFSPGLWGAVLLSIFIISACTCCLSAALHQLLPGFTKERMSLGRSFLDTLAMLVLQVPNQGHEEARYSPWKHFMLWLSVYSLLITSLYSGGLASVLTIPRYERPINTLVDMATSDLTWMFPHEAVIWAFQDSEDPVLRTIADKYTKVSDEELVDIALKGKVAVHIEELSGGVFSYGSYISIDAMSRLRLMKEPILVAHVVLIARKGGPYMQPLNDLILALNQGGLGTYWQADVVRRFLSSRLQLQIALSRSQDEPDGDTPRTLQLSHVQGAFILLGLGFIISVVVFVTELAIHSRYKKPYH